jgi:RNA polymerase sigma-70 factor, ECF subfamily
MTLRRRTGGSEEDGPAPFGAEALSHLDRLYGLALRLTRRPADAEDLVQETYLKAFRFASSFERGTNLKAWLFTILHNTWRNRRRDQARDPVRVDTEAVDEAAATAGSGATLNPEQLLARATLDADLQAALDSLSDTLREAVWLRDVEELSYAEIASALDVPIGTVMSRISRGRQALYAALTSGRTDRPSRRPRGVERPKAEENEGDEGL